MHSNFFNDPTVDEFYPRRIYARARRLGEHFCIVNNTAAPAYRDWDASTGIRGLMAAIRKWHQPAGDGSDAYISDVGFQMIERAVEHGHLVQDGTVWRKISPSS